MRPCKNKHCTFKRKTISYTDITYWKFLMFSPIQRKIVIGPGDNVFVSDSVNFKLGHSKKNVKRRYLNS